MAKSIPFATPVFVANNAKKSIQGGNNMQEQMLLFITKQLEEIVRLLEKQENKGTAGKIGRPTKEHVVLRYRENYPVARKTECTKATGLSIKTVSKYWDLYKQEEQGKEEKNKGREKKQQGETSER